MVLVTYSADNFEFVIASKVGKVKKRREKKKSCQQTSRSAVHEQDTYKSCHGETKPSLFRVYNIVSVRWPQGCIGNHKIIINRDKMLTTLV